MKYIRGFTLIELLVVIAIIGVLSAVVLTSLNNARTKGNDAAIKSSLAGARSQAELFFDTNSYKYMGTAGTADDVCSSTGQVGTVKGIYAMVKSAGDALGGGTTVIGGNAQAFVPGANNTAATTGAVVCHSASAGWAAIVSLKKPATANAGWCVDSSGASREVTVLSGTVCGQ